MMSSYGQEPLGDTHDTWVSQPTDPVNNPTNDNDKRWTFTNENEKIHIRDVSAQR